MGMGGQLLAEDQPAFTPKPVKVYILAGQSNTAAIVNPKTLTFDSSNHATAQSIRITGLAGASSAEAFDVQYRTTSDDVVYNALSDSWEYTNNRSATETFSVVEQADRNEVMFQDSTQSFNLGVTGYAESNTTIAAPFNGAITWSGTDVIYTPTGIQ